MGQAPSDSDRLEAAAARQAEHAAALTEALAEIRRSMEALDAKSLGEAVRSAQARAEQLQQTAAATTLAATRLASRLGLPDSANHLEIARAFGARGSGLRETLGGLSSALQSLAAEAASLGIIARYGNGLWGHLVGLHRAAVGFAYGPRGLVGPVAAGGGRRA